MERKLYRVFVSFRVFYSARNHQQIESVDKFGLIKVCIAAGRREKYRWVRERKRVRCDFRPFVSNRHSLITIWRLIKNEAFASSVVWVCRFWQAVFHSNVSVYSLYFVSCSKGCCIALFQPNGLDEKHLSDEWSIMYNVLSL